MDLPQLIDLIAVTDWFSEAGAYSGSNDYIAITNLLAPEVSEPWQWLPTSRDEVDPFHSLSLKEVTEQQGKGADAKDAALLVFKATLVSLRRVNEADPRFVLGPHNLAGAAKGGALYSTHHCAMEIVSGHPSCWHSLVDLYSQGHWPCGYTESRKILVY